MKRTILAVIILVLSYGIAVAQTDNKTPVPGKGLNKNCPGYVDANKDGICDNLGTKNCLYTQGRGQGMRNGRRGMGSGQGMRNGGGRGVGRGQGRGFVDANNNGICDYYEKAATNK